MRDLNVSTTALLHTGERKKLQCRELRKKVMDVENRLYAMCRIIRGMQDAQRVWDSVRENGDPSSVLEILHFPEFETVLMVSSGGIWLDPESLVKPIDGNPPTFESLMHELFSDYDGCEARDFGRMQSVLITVAGKVFGVFEDDISFWHRLYEDSMEVPYEDFIMKSTIERSVVDAVFKVMMRERRLDPLRMTFKLFCHSVKIFGRWWIEGSAMRWALSNFNQLNGQPNESVFLIVSSSDAHSLLEKRGRDLPREPTDETRSLYYIIRPRSEETPREQRDEGILQPLAVSMLINGEVEKAKISFDMVTNTFFIEDGVVFRPKINGVEVEGRDSATAEALRSLCEQYYKYCQRAPLHN
jgi:hypothetical protein